MAFFIMLWWSWSRIDPTWNPHGSSGYSGYRIWYLIGPATSLRDIPWRPRPWSGRGICRASGTPGLDLRELVATGCCFPSQKVLDGAGSTNKKAGKHRKQSRLSYMEGEMHHKKCTDPQVASSCQADISINITYHYISLHIITYHYHYV
jgi:hypothetical protein